MTAMVEQAWNGAGIPSACVGIPHYAAVRELTSEEDENMARES